MPTNLVEIGVTSDPKAQQNGLTIILSLLALCLSNVLIVLYSPSIAETVQLTVNGEILIQKVWG